MIEWIIAIGIHIIGLAVPILLLPIIMADIAICILIFNVGRNKSYGRYVWLHKLRVLQAGRIIGVGIVHLIFHDWDKLLVDNWIAYAEQFYALDGARWPERREYSDEFKVEWAKHQNRNRHHWQYWVMIWDTGEEECLEMPLQDVLEMLADWAGAGAAITGKMWPDDDLFAETREWYGKNRDQIKLHDRTRNIVEGYIGYVASK